MSTMQRLTLIGLYKYDPTLFDALTLPEEYDKATFIDSLMIEHGEKCVLYSNVDFMKYSIGAWGRKWALELERIAEALQAEYNPIYNYDRFEHWTETDKPDVTTTRTHNNTDTQTNRYDVVSTQNIDGTAEHQVSADNSSTYQPESKDTTNSGKTTVSNDGTITDAHTGTITDAEKGTRTNIDHDGHLYGNVGVTTSASMVSEVVAQRYQYNLYGTAARIFANELLIGIY